MLSIIIPVFNEEKIIFKTIKDIQKINIKKEIIVINDCSTDKSLKEIKKIKNIILINNKKNIGYGASIKKGIRICKSDQCMIIDGDGTYPADKIPIFLKKFRNKNEMIIGKRVIKENRNINKLLRQSLNLFIFILTLKQSYDANSGMRIFSKKFVSRFLHLCSDRFSFSTSLTMLYILKKKKIKYIKIAYSKRVGFSKVNLFFDALKTFKRIIQIYYKIKIK